MLIPISEVRSKIVHALMLRNLSKDEAETIAAEILDAELAGYSTHGVGKLTVINDAITAREGKPVIRRESAIHALVDGRKELGYVAGNLCSALAIAKAEATGIGIVALTNASRYGRLAPYACKIAKAGFTAMVINSGGPAAVAPYGTYKPILGTNPISFAFPSRDAEIVVMDFSTSKAVWGEIRQAMLWDRPLPSETFYNTAGHFTRDPSKAEAVKAFDEAKGYALCLAVELLCGALIGAKMGLQVETEYDLGFLFLAVSPTLFRDDIDQFYSEIDQLKREIKACPPVAGHTQVFIPGERSSLIKSAKVEHSKLQLDARVWELILRMSQDPTEGLGSSRQTN